MRATISRWGNSLAIRLPKGVLEATRLAEGDLVDVRPEGGNLIVTRTHRRSLDDLVAGITPENRHAEILDTAVGNEAW
ncbi:MAG: AbrB/MazE/SpoVT family DNA-binding domain-containing protein [Candidatus Eremiobacteraeota bacterium]|nr:AbrB/MazE/SpoVT family DNA-binding domain-containing protein [Candidatus Eremiobacteraeota bacterium]